MKYKIDIKFLIVILSGVLFITFSKGIYGQSNERNKAKIFLTAQSAQKYLEFAGYGAFEPLSQPEENFPTLIVDPSKRFQIIEGFGGAFTDATAETFALLSSEKKRLFLAACFDTIIGNGYRLCRTSIHSSDFSSTSYTYTKVPNDTNLKTFSIEHEKLYRIPLINEAQKVAGNKIKLFASPWSPPAWMKTNNNMLHGGKLKPEYRQSWANYFVKYIDAFQKEGLPVWGITVQNEPMAAQIFESCIYTAEEEHEFVRDYLGPTLHKNEMANVKLMIWDHNRGLMYQRVQAIYDDPETSKYVWGTGFHMYVGDHFDNVRLVHEAYPDKKLIFTEAGFPGDNVSLDNLDAAESMAKSMIHDLNNWANGWVFWNMLLNEEGSPCHVGFHGLPPVIYNRQTDELIFHNTHYYFGHFSKYIKPGACRIICSSSDDELLATGFINQNGEVAIVVLNNTDKDKPFQVWMNKKALKTILPQHAIMTLIFKTDM